MSSHIEYEWRAEGSSSRCRFVAGAVGQPFPELAVMPRKMRERPLALEAGQLVAGS